MNGSYDKELPDEIPSKNLLKEIKGISSEKYFGNSTVIDIELAGYEVLGGLLHLFVNTIDEPEDARNKRLLLKMPTQLQGIIRNSNISYYKKLLVCSDFVSRMTDSYAMKLYRKLKGIEI